MLQQILVLLLSLILVVFFLSPTQRSSSTAREKLKVGRRSLIVKEKKNESGFVAYSADYGKPRHHPPKNN
ncbi:hypothetical protein DCAR_0727215 [Daucus carota subsp. sativus]|uniref:Uncharacterized protein n=1 Tax=Daucus carota subsp. sativus TaxID=79200 RepID=A0AAF0XGI6_DAUCS|nr:hypothetical protein DCAR_0727215 [Daucus carota subsp. sativus]